MKKTITIALGGRSFTLEEDAYQKLDAYLSGLRKRFVKDASLEELMTDIESSIAEKFEEMLGKHRSVVTITDVDGVIAVMGHVEEIAYDEDEQLAKDESKKEDDKKSEAPKRLYRNPDDVVIGGVCSGIAAYFGTDPAFIRILFVVLAFVNGIGFFAYLILWIAIPEATTPAQKLEMRGKQVNLSELQELVKEKAKTMETEGRSAWERMREKGKAAMDPGREPMANAAARTGSIFTRVIRAIAIVISSIIGIALCVSTGIAMALLTAVGAILLLNPGSPSIMSDLPLAELAGNPWYYVAVVSAYFVVLVPLIFLSLLGTTFIQRKQAFRPWPATALAIIWGVALTAGVHAGVILAPWVQNGIERAETAGTVTRVLDQKDFQNIVATDGLEVRIVRGDTFSVSFTGREPDMNRLKAEVKNGTLTLSQEERRWHGICVFCTSRRITGEITMPDLDRYEGRDISTAHIEGFAEGLELAMEDVSRTEVVLQGQHVTSTVRDVSRLTLTGTAERLSAEVRDASRLVADELRADTVVVTTRGVGRASVWPIESLEASAKNASRITYRGDSAVTSIQESDAAHVTQE